MEEMFGGRVRFSGYDRKQVHDIGLRTVVEQPDREPAILELCDVIATPRRHALYDRDGAIIMATSRVCYPFDLATHPGIDRAIRGHIEKIATKMPPHIEVGKIDVIEDEMYFGGI